MDEGRGNNSKVAKVGKDRCTSSDLVRQVGRQYFTGGIALITITVCSVVLVIEWQDHR